MDEILAQKAISTALEGNWNEAIQLNQKILKKFPKDIASLNRLSRAYTELGQIKNARKTAEKVIKIDPINKIAQKTLEKIKDLKEGEITASAPSHLQVFIEEPGKTKVVPLIHLGDVKIIAKLDAGDEVKLDCHCHRIQVSTLDGDYIGKLPDDTSLRIKKLINLGNKYQAVAKSSEPEKVKILIKEIFKSNKAKNIISFPVEKMDYISFASPNLVKKNDTVSISEEN